MPAPVAASTCLATGLGTACVSGPAAPVVAIAVLATAAVLWFAALSKN